MQETRSGVPISLPMPLCYSAFGLTLGSNIPIPVLEPQPQHAVVDTRIWFPPAVPTTRELNHLPAEVCYVSDTACETTPGLRVWRIAGGRYYKWLYGDGTEFLVEGSGREIWATWPASSTPEDTVTYLLGPILGFVLRLRNITSLHGSAVVIAERAVVMVGPPGAGKSTLAAAFGWLGYPVLSDDVAALDERDGQWYVRPAYPQVRLWPESVKLLFGSADALRPLTPNWNKRGLSLLEHGYCFEKRPHPIAAVYVLGERADRAEPHIERMHGRELLRTLLANTYVGYVRDETLGRQEFSTLARLAHTVPALTVLPPDNPSRLCDAIIEDCEALGCIPSPITAG